jgi:hypothetical protein
MQITVTILTFIFRIKPSKAGFSFISKKATMCGFRYIILHLSQIITRFDLRL